MMPVETAVGADRRARIIESAWDVLRRSGYANLKVHSVVRSSGASVGAFYRYFSSKDDLLAALLGEELRRATSELRSRTATGTPQHRVRAWIDALLSMAYPRDAASRARWFASLPADVREGVRMTADAEHDIRAPLREAIADGRAGGEFPCADPASDAALIESLCSRLEENRPAGLGEDRDATVEAVAQFVLAALTNPCRGRIGAAIDGPGALLDGARRTPASCPA